MNCDPNSLESAQCYRCISKGMLKEVWIYLMCAWANKSVDPVADWVSRVIAHGGAMPSGSTITAISSFVATLQSANLWSKMRAMNCFVPGDLPTALTPLVNLFGNDPWTNNGFVSGDLSVNGLINTTTKYLDTGFIPATHFKSSLDLGVSFCLPTGSAGANQRDLSASDAGGTNTFIAAIFATTLTFSVNGNATGTHPVPWNAFVSGNVSSSLTPNHQIASGNTANAFASRGSRVNAGGALTSFPLFVFARNSAGTVADNTPHTLSFVAIHDGLSLAEQTALCAAVKALRTALGGGAV